MILGGAILALMAIAILLFRGGAIEAAFIFGGLDALLAYYFIETWNEKRREKEKIAFETGGDRYRKFWIVKRRTVRSVIMLIIVAASVVGIVFWLHDIVRLKLYNNAFDKYQRELEIQEIKKKEYQEAIEQYYVDARLALGLDEDGWILAYVTIDREFVDRWGSLGSLIRFDYYVNGEQVKNGDSVLVQVFGENIIESQITEIDPSVNDVGISRDYVFLSPQELKSGKLFWHTVTVSENRGRYSGSYLTMRINYNFKAVRWLNTGLLDQIEMPEPPQLELLQEPKLEDIPDSYIYTFSHNVLGQLVLAAILTLLYKYCLYAWKKDERLLAEKIEDVERMKRAETWRKEQEQKRIREEEAAEVARLEEQKQMKARREAEEENRLDAIADAAYTYAVEKEKMRVALQDHTLEEIAGVPKKVKFTKDLLPYDEGFPGEYGHFSVYVTTEGKRFHAQKSCHGAWKEIHIFKAIEDRKSPCSICARRYPYSIPEWYEKYKDQLKKKEYYNL